MLAFNAFFVAQPVTPIMMLLLGVEVDAYDVLIVYLDVAASGEVNDTLAATTRPWRLQRYVHDEPAILYLDNIGLLSHAVLLMRV